MSELLGLYVDHQMTSPFAMAQHSAKIKPIANDLARSGVLLVTTCLRVEVYGEELALRNIDSTVFPGFSCQCIEGMDAIAQRLAEIASGAHSQILGENYISDQLAKAIELLDPNLPIFQIARLAIDIGRASRERQRFTAPFNYDQIVRDIIADRFQNAELPDRLYMIGAGMLGRELIRSGLGERFRSTVIVTRNPKNLRRRLRPWTDIDVALMRPAEIGHAREPRSIVVIATADVDDEYQAILHSALLRLEPRTIVDLSSIPVLSKSTVGLLNYVTMYHEEFLRFIAQNNKRLAPKRPLLCSDIEAALRTAKINRSESAKAADDEQGRNSGSD
ncbi:MAG: hypothetical protein EOQ39_34555 [Mesorhizobium sp.]|uniref:hypothetical protein n=1 Tax=Mesorhizobium sp. TaxID=1871066 RepID=UPI000FE67A83|nr:hypothetical protein [Mesorhizobium sp.]RWA97093.1 MAG: hypothetical protein EOQ37_35325 [Mesorhizobium sp.]RWB09336.1 MAG: hypothetical protein EOQ39_34555 [Mesorhizobium sp.]